MARVTVEDCLKHVNNRFDLVMLASKRARQLQNGKPSLVTVTNDKWTVLALREIAAGLVSEQTVRPQEDLEPVMPKIVPREQRRRFDLDDEPGGDDAL